jgi:hypothetical protein
MAWYGMGEAFWVSVKIIGESIQWGFCCWLFRYLHVFSLLNYKTRRVDGGGGRAGGSDDSRGFISEYLGR